MKKTNVSLVETLSKKIALKEFEIGILCFILKKTCKKTWKKSPLDRSSPSTLTCLKQPMETPEKSVQPFQS